MRRVLLVLALVSAAFTAGCGAAGQTGVKDGQAFTVGSNATRSPEALRLALADYDQAVARGESAAHLAAHIERVSRAAAQRDAHVSRLYWHTDLEEAKAAASRLGRPILSLRMLGRLDEELSCANSRFFRTTLYSNPEVARVLRDEYVLHWSSERPVPKVSIDYGDGRKVVRTITGNSIHYVLDAKGRPVDGLPGLYAARPFLDALAAVRPVALDVAKLDAAARAEAMTRHHRQALVLADASFRALAAKTKRPDLVLPRASAFAPQPSSFAPSAALAVNVAPTKAVLERPIVKGVTGSAREPDVEADPASSPFYESFPWSALSSAWSAAITDAPTLALMRAKGPRVWRGDRAEPVDDAGFRQIVRSFERSLTVDTLKNEYGVRRLLHEHFMAAPGEDLASLNRHVYSALFLTPADDPWLGLVPPRTFSGIAGDGLE